KNVIKNKKFMKIQPGYRSWFTLLLLFIFPLANAVELVTWSGTNGVNNSGVLNTCGSSSCHDATTQQAGLQLTQLSHFQNNRAIVNTRIQEGTMPPGGLSAGDQAFIAAWNSNLFANFSAPHAATVSATSISKTSATLRGNYNENGSSTDYVFQWGTSAGNLNQTLDVSPDPSGTGGSGTGTATQPD